MRMRQKIGGKNVGAFEWDVEIHEETPPLLGSSHIFVSNEELNAQIIKPIKW